MRPTVMRPGLLLMRHRCSLLSGGRKMVYAQRERTLSKPAGSFRSASSADRELSSKILRRPGHCQRENEEKQVDQSGLFFTAGKRLQKRQRQRLLVNRFSQPATYCFPERASNKAVPPPFAPALD